MHNLASYQVRAIYCTRVHSGSSVGYVNVRFVIPANFWEHDSELASSKHPSNNHIKYFHKGNSSVNIDYQCLVRYICIEMLICIYQHILPYQQKFIL